MVLTRPLSQALLDGAAAARCGILMPATPVAMQACDMPGIHNAAVAPDPANPWQSVSGAVGESAEAARAGAIAEGLERHAAALAQFELRPRSSLAAHERLDEAQLALYAPPQRAQAGFPWPMEAGGDDGFACVYRLSDNQPRWVPQELVGLGPRSGAARMPSTSSGLAAHRDAAAGPWLALLRAAQELLERDALTVTWLNGLGGREIGLPASLAEAVAVRGGQAQAYDLTQAWNPHPVVAVAGMVAQEGAPRIGLGIACRATRAEALDKAWLEWAQALTFAGYMRTHRSDTLPREPQQLRAFDEHAAFYTLRPELWPATPFVAHAAPYQPPVQVSAPADAAGQLHALQRALTAAGIELYYRELTTPDVAQAGLRVMRVLSPQLASLHADERAPFLGGRCRDVAWRYPGAQSHGPFPNPLPHPLG